MSNAVILPISGWLARVIGRKQFYMSCVALFGASSLLCGLAPSLGLLIFFRVLQGLGGGGLAPSEQSILADSFEPSQRGQAFALYGIAVVVAPTLGPTLGGFITDSFSWRWIFLINVPVCLLSLFLAGMVLVDPPAVKKDREDALKGGLKIDYLGFLLVAVGLACLQVVLDKGTEDDWFASDFILIFSVISAVCLTALIFWELNHDDPIVDLPLMRNRNFSSAMLVMFVTGFILISTTQMLPQFLQSIMNYTATKAGLALTAGGAATLVMMPVVGVMLRKAQPRYMIAFGLVVEAAACVHLRGIQHGCGVLARCRCAHGPGIRAALSLRAYNDRRLCGDSRRQEQQRLGAHQHDEKPRRKFRDIARRRAARKPGTVPPCPPRGDRDRLYPRPRGGRWLDRHPRADR